MHTAHRAEDNFHEGYETWLLQEAKKRVRAASFPLAPDADAAGLGVHHSLTCGHACTLATER